MKLIVCLDDKNGMAFNHRRQSRDRIVLERIQKLAEGACLRMSPYSAKLFPESSALASPDFLQQAKDGDFCFIELEDGSACEERVQRVIVFRWNRVYPADLHFGIDLGAWHRISAEEFPGSSHEKITMEVYQK